MSLKDWTAIYGSKGNEITSWHTAGNKCYISPIEPSVICHKKTLSDRPIVGYIDFDFRFTIEGGEVGAVFKASSSEFLLIKISVKESE